MGILETNGVDFATFRLAGSAKTWWRDFCLARPAGSPSLTWDQFSELFLGKFLPVTQRDALRRQFERLQQGSMSVTQYETQFIDLARHTIVILPTERERVRSFVDGLVQPIRVQMAMSAGSEITFQETADGARWIELTLSQGGGHGSDKRPCHSGKFSGTSSGGRDSYGRGHPSRPFQSALQASHGTPGGRGSQPQYSDQQLFSSPSAPISAPSLRYSQQSRACYTCVDVSHIARYCPRASSSSQQQGPRPMIQAPVAPQPAQPARGGGRGHRGGTRGLRGGAQTARGRGQPTADRPRDMIQGGGGPAPLLCLASQARG
ncbi:uncharacterized protein [Nicotiana sylvestris]|uniref:uncharacterized protein n=1 Tax=Nicotiana sylvestris TaxID=4096 RepID=UPI00388C7EC4